MNTNSTKNPLANNSTSERWNSLIHRAKEGCTESFEEIFEQLYNYLILTTGTRISDGLRGKFGASDIVQSGLIKAYGALDKFEGSSEAELRAWARKIVLNRLKDKTRRFSSQKRSFELEHRIDDVNELSHKNSPSDIALRKEERMMLQRQISMLPAIEQRVVEMRHRFGYSIAEISDILKISYSKAQYAWKNGISKLRVRIKDHEMESSVS